MGGVLRSGRDCHRWCAITVDMLATEMTEPIAVQRV